MTVHYITHFDANYLPHGFALIDSLERHCKPYRCTVLALDDAVIMRSTALPKSVEVMPLGKLESMFPDKSIYEAKRNRTYQEYCWTLEPVLCCWAAWKSPCDDVVYVDSDVMMFAPLDVATASIPPEAEVAATPHGFPSGQEHREKHAGRYNVGVMWFRPTWPVRELFGHWMQQTLDSCKLSDCGDQKYLDGWSEVMGERFHDWTYPGVNCGPWQLPEISGDPPMIRDVPLQSYHYHEMRRADGPGKNVVERDGKFWRLTYYPVAEPTRRSVYDPYLEALSKHA